MNKLKKTLKKKGKSERGTKKEIIRKKIRKYMEIISLKIILIKKKNIFIFL